MVFLSTLSLRRATSAHPEIRRPCAISIHALLAESDGILSTLIIGFSGFLSTLSLRRATHIFSDSVIIFLVFLSTLSLRRATEQLRQKDIQIAISIHALLAESDKKSFRSLDTGQIFLSTLSLRRATARVVMLSMASFNFYPRSPCGERPVSAAACSGVSYFYPRSPCGERHLGDFLRDGGDLISIHALLAESDHTS